MKRQRRVLLGQLSANGDCVYATTIAHQIKSDDPGCHLTWAIGSECRQVIQNNPHVDEVWEVPDPGRQFLAQTWRRFVQEARARQRHGDFDEVHLTQISPDNFAHFDGTVRASIFRGYSRPITVPVTPVIRLSEPEVERVEEFAARHDLERGSPIVFFESSPRSKQSLVTPTWALEVCRLLAAELPHVRVILSPPPSEALGAPWLIDGSTLGFRDVAWITRYCALFVGCSSGLTWVSTSDVARKIPMIQILSREARMYGAVTHDLQHWGLPSDHVIEMRDASPERAARCAFEVLTRGVADVRPRYHEDAEIRFDHYYRVMMPFFQRELPTAARSLRLVVERYGPRTEIVTDLLSHLSARIWNRLKS
jgi:ADP-heptose:LPS heptosyltransferase